MKKSVKVTKKSAVKPIPDWQVRVMDEQAALMGKIKSLQEALRASVLKNSVADGELIGGFDPVTTLELFEQLTHMQEYSKALHRRIDRF